MSSSMRFDIEKRPPCSDCMSSLNFLISAAICLSHPAVISEIQAGGGAGSATAFGKEPHCDCHCCCSKSAQRLRTLSSFNCVLTLSLNASLRSSSKRTPNAKTLPCNVCTSPARCFTSDSNLPAAVPPSSGSAAATCREGASPAAAATIPTAWVDVVVAVSARTEGEDEGESGASSGSLMPKFSYKVSFKRSSSLPKFRWIASSLSALASILPLKYARLS
mmetsp:Transcript_27898/g.70062  ORF Transcript_27898/g.70062 Transcript_27898/m.70062 type:complete len:220 (+) Transcript_27898:616-1275(+)